MPTSRDRLLVPKVNYSDDDIYSTGARVTWTGEVPSSSTVHCSTEPKFGHVAISVWTAMISMTATNDMVEDSAFPFVSWLSEKFAETYRLLLDEQIIAGTGIGRPAGILLDPGGTDQPAVVNSGAAAELTADGLQDLAWSLPEQYDENSAWAFNKTSTGKAIAKLKDADNRYLWASLEASGLVLPARQRPLLGYPVAFSGFMPNVAANAFPAIFGDLSGYFLVERVGMSIQVLRETHAEDNQVGLLGRVRFGGLVAEPYKMKILKVAA
jgi:HK97 family phage major capsid protein